MTMVSSAQHRRSWRVNIQAKGKGFDFKLCATSLFLHCHNCSSFFQFSAKLKRFSFLIRLRSEPEASSPRRIAGSSKSKLVRFIKRLWARGRTKSVPIPNSCNQREFFSPSSVPGPGGIVGLLGRAISKGDRDEVFMATLFCVTRLFRNFSTRDVWVFMVLLIAGVVGFSGIINFRNHFTDVCLLNLLGR
ncbi:unnamed protein product [Cuscuta campestris]|uniref:Uncharacterized protein n=1 Tax=Cuscuta campestris TaxID=132261 RepID=A0A484MJN2_9ASTE|nr:unnamed protein product [Cuscuta campestris]